MSAATSSNWSDEPKVFKCNAKSSTKQPFSILLIGNTTWSTQLSDSLIEYNENNHVSPIQVHKAISVKSALSTLSNIYADLVEMNLVALEPALLCGRTILVNPKNDLKLKEMGISYENIDNLKKKYDLLIIHGNIEDHLSRIFIARRIMTYSYKINNKGLPNILNFTTFDM
ncbi:uncharacterized protein LOC112689492 isoform X2 [Sipha flava]|uniref:Uncharacterized protein LOC112689492 isoform X2 n=1 Tax=Sipha flava TaxID=143950 RepID=A0A8B8G8S5_9HEMI|nr:uncharacterized protein LOC112689492 isoform X2 [Sipha flava]